MVSNEIVQRAKTYVNKLKFGKAVKGSSSLRQKSQHTLCCKGINSLLTRNISPINGFKENMVLSCNADYLFPPFSFTFLFGYLMNPWIRQISVDILNQTLYSFTAQSRLCHFYLGGVQAIPSKTRGIQEQSLYVQTL